MRYVPAGLPHFRDEADFLTLGLIVECEEPCEDLYRFNGNILIPPDLPRQHSSLGTILEQNGAGPSSTEPHIAANNSHHHPPGTPTSSHTRKSSLNGGLHARNGSTGSGPKKESVGTALKVAFPELLNTGNRSKNRRRVGVSDFNMIFLGMDNVILRGTKVKNTDFVYGVVVYTGPDTRLARNSKPTAPKFSTVERFVVKQLSQWN